MKKAAYSIALLLVAATAFLAGAWYSHRRTSVAGARKVLYYVDPMHPAYKSDKPGIAPDCGMQLEPVYADGGPAEEGGAGAASGAPGTVHISPEKQQLVGVRLGTVEKTTAGQTLRLFGRVAPDDTRVYSINAGIGGSIRDLAPVTAGSRVRKDQVLGSFYAPDALSMLQLFIVNTQGYDRLGTQRFKADGSLNADGKGEDETDVSRKNSSSLYRANVQQRIMQLENIGVSALQREEIVREGRVPDTIKIVAPANGIVLSRSVTPGRKFDRGEELFRIADLRRVWILADVFANDARHVRPGIVAQVSLPDQNDELTAKVAEVLPQFDAATRTLKVRLEAENPGYVLWPDMFVDVAFPIDLPAATTVPVDAIVDTGLKKMVYVDLGNGFFEPRTVETGWRFGDKVEIVKGLEPGERIVVSGTFLVDSESRLESAAAGIYGAASEDPVCGMDVDEGKARAAGKILEHQGKTWFFCSEGCKHDFERSPERYLASVASRHEHAGALGEDGAPAAAPERVHAAAATDPICGMKVDEKKAAKAGQRSEHGGRAYFFCSDACKRKFDGNPQRHAARVGGHAMKNEAN